MRAYWCNQMADFNHFAELVTHQEQALLSEPLNTIIKVFSSYGVVNPQEFAPISLYFDRIPVPHKYVLWKQGDQPDGLYILESGLVKAIYSFENPAQDFEESMVPGTIAGELSALANSPRNCTAIVEHAGVLWKLSSGNLHKLQIEQPELARIFLQFVLKGAYIGGSIGCFGYIDGLSVSSCAYRL